MSARRDEQSNHAEQPDRNAQRANAGVPAESAASATGQLVVNPAEQEERGERYKPIDWEICRRLFFGYMWRYKGLQTWIIVLVVLLALVNIALPVLISRTIGWSVEDPSRWASLSASIESWTGIALGSEAIDGIVFGAALCALTAVIYYVVMFIRLVAINVLSERVIYDLRSDIYKRVQDLDMAFFDRTKLGWILSRGTSDVNAVRHAVAQVVPRTLLHGFEALGIVIWLFLFVDWFMCLVILMFVPGFWFLNAWFRRRMGEAWRQVQFSMSRITASIAETVGGIRVTQSFAREEVNQTLFRDLCLNHRSNNMRAAHFHGLYIPLLDVVNQLLIAMIICVGGWRAFNGHMDVANLIEFLLLTGRVFFGIQVLAEVYNTTLQAMAGGERIFRLLDTEPEIVDAPGAKELARTSRGAKIEFENVTFSYTEGRPVLRDLSFVCEPGETVAIVGHTGSGKTTIVSLLGRLYAHQRGRILIDGTDIEQLTLESLRDQLGLVLQDNFLFTGTVIENIRFGRPDATDEEVEAACRALDCFDLFEQLPNGLYSEVGERGDNLSLGQRQLTCFARAMLADPRILMLDEATSAVDTHTEHRLQLALERLTEGRTSVVVAHRLSTIRRADRILVLEHGELLEQGKHDDLLERGGRYAELYQQFVRLSGGA